MVLRRLTLHKTCYFWRFLVLTFLRFTLLFDNMPFFCYSSTVESRFNTFLRFS